MTNTPINGVEAVISRDGARRFVDGVSPDDLAAWEPCERGNCMYCAEVERLRAIRRVKDGGSQ